MENKNFIFEFEQELRKFESRIEQWVLKFFKEHDLGSTYEITNYVKHHYYEFNKLYKQSRTKGLYRIRKVLKRLWKRGILRRSDYFTPGRAGKLVFPTYIWTIILEERRSSF